MSKLLLSFALLSLGFQAQGAPKSGAGAVELDQIYHSAQRKFHKRNYKDSLPLLEKYLNQAKGQSHRRERLFWVIDQIGRIHLRVNRNPESALTFFNKVKDDARLNEAERDDIQSWVSAAKEWKEFGKYPKDLVTPDKLFEIGSQYYNRGAKKLEYPADDAGDAYFHIAATYLVPFLVNNDGHKRVPDALYMMGEIRRHIRTDNEYWGENHYLKEVIRRYPHTKLAQKAYRSLRDDLRAAFSGSGGDFTPPSVLRGLKRYKALADPKPAKKKKG